MREAGGRRRRVFMNRIMRRDDSAIRNGFRINFYNAARCAMLFPEMCLHVSPLLFFFKKKGRKRKKDF